MQRQATVKVILVVDDEATLDDAVDIVVEALEEAEIMANVQVVKIENVKN